MLYVFHVDTGTMMTCDMNLALESVHHLKEYVERTCNIPRDKQVLLVSGGESLDPESRVCAYSAGTDTNPIFLFSKSIIESITPPSINVEYVSDAEFLGRVKEAVTDLPADYSTVVHRTHLAQQFYDLAKEQIKVCKKLVHDQHMQQQGWAAVVANLDDITMEFKKRADLCEKQFSDYMTEREEYALFLQSFQQDLHILSRIPLLPVLAENEKLFEEAVSAETSTTREDVSESEADKNVTLLGWISASDDRKSMDQLKEMCSKGLQQFDHKLYNSICSDIKIALEDANKPEMKEVKGIGDRLYGLEQLMCEAKRYVQEQGDLAQSLLQNQNRAGNVGDRSVLPDLCASHRKQLVVMLNNHKQLCDIRRRCTKAKDELIVNLYYRLKWVMYVENTILETSHKLFICHENLKRLRKHLEVLQQIHLAPAIYLTAITEVIRRKTFSQAFLVWASELACHLLTIYNNEVSRRKEFHSQFEGHFLNSLFPGMDDLPPTFATQAPPIFDASLPNVTLDDIQMLKEALPEMADNLALPDLSGVLTFFESKLDGKLDKEDTMAANELAQEVQDLRLSANTEQSLSKAVENESCVIAHSLPHLKDFERGCESETDTEEFEKLCQSPLDLHFDKEIPSPRAKTQDVATLTEVGERGPSLPPKKPPRIFQKLQQHSFVTSQHTPIETSTSPFNISAHGHRTFSYSGSQSNTTDSFTNIKNPSLDSMDDFSSLKNLPATMESCYNSHHHQQQRQQREKLHGDRVVDVTISGAVDGDGTGNNAFTNVFCSKSVSPHTPSSPRDIHLNEQPSPTSPVQVHQQVGAEFVTDEYYIDESLPSSLSMDAAGGGQSQGEFAKQLDTANNVVALLQDNLHSSRTEYDKLKTVLCRLSELVRQALPDLKAELLSLKDSSLKDKDVIVKHYECLTESLQKVNLATYLRDREELVICRRDLENTNRELKCLREENENLEHRFQSCMQENAVLKNEIDKLRGMRDKDSAELNKNMEKFEVDEEKKLRDLRDTLGREHKAELESLRCRFKLMVDQSPTDPSQDRLEQLKEDFENKKAEAIESAITVERKRWEHVLKDTIAKITKEREEEKQFLKRENEEKERQLNMLRLEIGVLKEASNENDSISESKKTDEMAASVGLFEGRVDAATSPVKHQDTLTRSQLSLLKTGKFCLNSCNVGDVVLVVWEPSHENYKILQDNSTYYFLHSDCLEVLGLKRGDNEEQKSQCVGQVTNKEYCHARKAQNRYKVSIGTKFYRVSVKPVNPEMLRGLEIANSSKHHHHHRMSESQPAALPSTSSEHHRSQQEAEPWLTSQSTLLRSQSTMESSVVTGCTLASSQNESSNR